MKRTIALLVLALSFTFGVQAQDKMMKKESVKTVTLEQTKGAFTQDKLTLKEGAYVFNIKNNNAGTDVGFVLVPSGKDASNPKNHIQEAYVTQVVKEGKTESSNTVNLSKGTYTYFCPLNKTPQYTLVVE
ncbi:MAG: cupredoxin domain-containing protein [Bacteroidota bacterium]